MENNKKFQFSVFLILSISMALSFSSIIPAQEILLEVVDNPQDIRLHRRNIEGNIIDIHSDNYGYLWLATSRGLKCFDGYETKVYQYENTPYSIPDDYINSIMEDSSGVLWISTKRGFCRYNRESETFTSFFPDSSQSGSWNNHILFTREDSQGIIWLYTFGTVFSFDRETEVYTSYEDEIKELWVSASGRHSSLRSEGAFLEDRDSDIWISDWQTVYKIDRETGEVRNFLPDLKKASGLDPIAREHYLAEDKKGNIWVTTFGDGVFRLIDEEQGIFKYYRHDPGDPKGPLSNFINRIQLDRNGELWFMGQNGFFKYNYESDNFLNYRIFEGPDDRNFNDYRTWFFRSEKSGVKWFVATRGIFRYDPSSRQVEHFFNNPDLPNSINEDVNDIVIGEDGTVWISSLNSELIKWDGSDKPFQSFQRQINEPKGLKEPRIRSMYVDSNDVLWLGTMDQGLYLAYPRQNSYDFVPYLWKVDTKSYLDNPRINWITCDGSGNFWLCSQDGLRKASPQADYHWPHKRSLGFTRYTNPILGGDYTRYVMEDSQGKIWIGMGGSIKLLDIETGRISTLLLDPIDFTGIEGDFYTEVVRIFEDRSSRMWIGTNNGGLFQYSMKDSSLIRYQHKPGNEKSISSDAVRQILEDKWGRLWMGTGRGLNLFNDTQGTFTKFGEEAGLKGEMMMGLLSDDKGNLWISHDKGLSKMLLSENDSCLVTPVFYNYDESDGIGGIDFERNAYTRSPSGEIYFGGENGFIRFNPDSITINLKIPKVYITSVHTEYCPECTDGYRRRTFDDPVMDLEEIHLKSKDKVFSFEFTAISFTNSGKNQFAYMLEGFEEEWIYCGSRRNVRYTNIDPGEYTFRVKACNNDGVWNEEGASLQVIIHPPWYRTILAYLLYGLFIMLAIFGYIRWRTYRLKQDKMILEREVKQRTATIVEQKDEILAANKEILNANTQLEEQKEELEQHTEELTQQKEELQITLDRLKETQEQLIQSEKLAALGGLVAGVAHEINTPVGISVTAASNLTEETKIMAEKYKSNKISKADFKEYLSTANQSAKLILSNMERTATMVQSFKQVSVDQSTEQKRLFKLKEYTEDVIRSLYPRLKQKKVNIKLDIDDALEMNSFPGAFSQILTNLLLNSMVHGFPDKETGEICLSSEMTENELELVYSDDGKGIEKNNMEKIFDPFFTTNKKAGTGLGLHIVYNLVTQKLNGKINCESTQGKGVMFSIRMPVD